MHARKISEEQLTAYVMGEGTADERDAVEAAMKADPALRAEADELRAFCGTLWDELKDVPVPSTMPITLASRPRARRKSWALWAAIPALAAAAAVTAYVMAVPQLSTRQKTSGNAASEVRYVPAAGDEAARVAGVLADKPPPAATRRRRAEAPSRGHPSAAGSPGKAGGEGGPRAPCRAGYLGIRQRPSRRRRRHARRSTHEEQGRE